MFKNYFYLLRSVHELNNVLKDSTIIDIYSQDKNILYLHTPTEDYPDRHLIISANPQFPYLLIKNNHRKAKKNFFDVFKVDFPLTIKKIEIAKNDRLIKISLFDATIYFSVRGNRTNIHFIDKTKSELTFKKTDHKIFREAKKLSFTNDLNFERISNDSNIYNDFIDIRNNYPMISSEIKNEILFRFSKDEKQSFSKIFTKIIDEIFTNEIRVGFNSDLGKVIFVANSFSVLKTENSKLFNSVNESLHFYISSFYKESSKKSFTKELDKYFDKELSSLANKLNKLNNRVENGSKESQYYNYGNILLSNIYKIKKGMTSIILEDYTSGEEQNIKLNQKLSGKENIDRYFEKAKDEKVNFSKSLELLNFTKEKYNKLKTYYDQYTSTTSKDEIEEIYNKIIPKKNKIIKMDSGLKFKYWHYLIDEKYHVYIGRDSKSNDYLSIKFAKQNDYWFHARGLPGSTYINMIFFIN